MDPTNDFQDESDEDLDSKIMAEEEVDDEVRRIMAERGVEREEAERLLRLKNEFDLSDEETAPDEIEEQ